MSKPLADVLAITLLAACALPALAHDPNNAQSPPTKAQQSALDWSDITANERARAEAWRLSADEWHRYRSLMEGIRGSISPGTISPIEVLGIHARDDAERRRYAEQWAMMMREDTERILAFQHAYDQAGRLLYPTETLIDVARLPDRDEDQQALLATDRVLLFARPDCAACDAICAAAGETRSCGGRRHLPRRDRGRRRRRDPRLGDSARDPARVGSDAPGHAQLRGWRARAVGPGHQ